MHLCGGDFGEKVAQVQQKASQMGQGGRASEHVSAAGATEQPVARDVTSLRIPHLERSRESIILPPPLSRRLLAQSRGTAQSLSRLPKPSPPPALAKKRRGAGLKRHIQVKLFTRFRGSESSVT